MRVALISRGIFPLHGYGGLERHVAGLFKYLRRAGCDVSLYTTPPKDSHETPDGIRYVTYRLVPWPRRKGFVLLDRETNYLAWSLRAAKRVLADPRPDVVQADGAAAFGYAFTRDENAPPLVLHPHGMEEFKAPPLKRTAYLPLRSATRLAARRAERVLAPDVSMRTEVMRLLGIGPDRVAVLPNAIDLEEVARWRGGFRDLSRFGIAPDDRVLLSVGRLELNKGFAVLARALAELPREWKWVLVGEGPERDKLERTIAELGLRQHVTLTGSIPDEDLSALYDRATLFVHPTLYEGSSMVTLEAMAHGKPVIASRVGGIPDKVLDGRSGLLVPPGDASALASAIREAARSSTNLAAWGAEAERLAREKFDWATRVKDVLALYDEIGKSAR
ncbi:MAG TPA: glycosyltransferase family 4 protein [Vicinamibacteria bacterium]|nr:glycosyltransferase family 4 protein [Vicinamibacteria bacterium]